MAISTLDEVRRAYIGLAHKARVAEASDREIGEDIICLASEGFEGEAQTAFTAGKTSGFPDTLEGKLFDLVNKSVTGDTVCELGYAILSDDPANWEGQDAEDYLKYGEEAEGDYYGPCACCGESPCRCDGEQRVAADLIRKAIDTALHGEVFGEPFGMEEGDGSRGLVVVTNEILGENEEDAKEEESTWHGIWKPTVEDDDQAVALWKLYFSKYPSHGEYAGLVCCLLVDAERWADIVAVLNICKAAEGYFGWDS